MKAAAMTKDDAAKRENIFFRTKMNAEKAKTARNLALKDAAQDPYFFRPEKSSTQTKKQFTTNVLLEKGKFLIKPKPRVGVENSSDLNSKTNLLVKSLNVDRNRKQMRIEDFIKKSSHKEAKFSDEHLSAEIESVSLSSSNRSSSVFSISEVDFDDLSTNKVLSDRSNKKLDKIKQFVKINEEIKRKELVKISSLDEFLSECKEQSKEESSAYKMPGKVHRNKSVEDVVTSDSSISILDDDDHYDDDENKKNSSSCKFHLDLEMESEIMQIRFAFPLQMRFFYSFRMVFVLSQLKELTEPQIEYLIIKNASYFMDIFAGKNVKIYEFNFI
jgi:hypothetical protein